MRSNSTAGRSRKGPPEAVSQIWATSPGAPPRRHWWMALCSESMGSSGMPRSRAAARRRSPAATRHSLLARPTIFAGEDGGVGGFEAGDADDGGDDEVGGGEGGDADGAGCAVDDLGGGVARRRGGGWKGWRRALRWRRRELRGASAGPGRRRGRGWSRRRGRRGESARGRFHRWKGWTGRWSRWSPGSRFFFTGDIVAEWGAWDGRDCCRAGRSGGVGERYSGSQKCRSFAALRNDDQGE